ncbi:MULTISPECIES: porin family protein [unclassified Fibrobacter]|uniref:porin family protein n=1 Tax=unclassified Fibrobacter TaxID=2634177 RepID=UPI0025BAC87A|nr:MULTISPECIES: porin family protein [unclassified Fibrobacter]
MFKKIILAAALAATASFAQLSFGVHAGGDLNNVWGDDTDNSESGIGFNFGGAIKFSLPLLPLTVEANVLADMRNYEFEYGITDYSVTQWNIDIPVLARFSPLPIIFIEAGPQFSFNISQSAEDASDDEIKNFDKLLPMNSFEFDLVFGLGTGIIPFVDVDFRVVLGMTNIYDDIDVPLVGSDEINASNLQFVLGATYWF